MTTKLLALNVLLPLICVAPEDFSRERMTQLARQLNHDYANESEATS